MKNQRQYVRRTGTVLSALGLILGLLPGFASAQDSYAPYQLSELESRAVTQENPTGAKGMGGKDKGNGNRRKGAPAFRNVLPGETKTLCDIEGPGMVRHIWITVEDYLKKDPETGWERFVSFYRFHVHDPIFFKQGLRVELQQLGAGNVKLTEENKKKYGWVGPHIHPGMSSWLYERSDDYCSVVYWYQKVSDQPMQPPLPGREARTRGIEKQPWE